MCGHDIHKQRSDDIAINEKNYFWQPPSKPTRLDQGIAGERKYELYKRPDPLDLIMSNAVTIEPREEMAYLFVQRDCVVVY
jgi:hypothetical protein